MFRKAIFISASACACLLALAFLTKSLLIELPAGKPVTVRPFTPTLPDKPPLLLMDESTGLVFQTIQRDLSTGLISGLDAGFRDGRSGSFSFEKGKLRAYRAYDENKVLRFEAEYNPNGLFASYRTLRTDGSVESSFRRLPDLSEELRFFDKSGFCVKSIVTARDGTQSTSSFKSHNTPAEITVVKPEARELTYGPIASSSAEKKWRFTVKLSGARVSEWEYRDQDGKLRHRGRCNTEGEIEITYLNQQEQPALKQRWLCVGEDWSRRFYRLAELQRLNPDESIQSNVILHEDGVTPREVSTYWDGHKSNTEYYDAQGFMYRQEYFDSNGFSNSAWDVQPQYRRRAKLPDEILSEPHDKAGAIYRLKGFPYADALPDEGYALNPLFVLPK